MGVSVTQAHIGHEQFDIEFPRHPVRVVPLRCPLLCLITHEQRGRRPPSRESWDALVASEDWASYYFPVPYMGGHPVDQGGDHALKHAYRDKEWDDLMGMINDLKAVPGLVAFFKRHGFPLDWSDI